MLRSNQYHCVASIPVIVSLLWRLRLKCAGKSWIFSLEIEKSFRASRELCQSISFRRSDDWNLLENYAFLLWKRQKFCALCMDDVNPYHRVWLLRLKFGQLSSEHVCFRRVPGIQFFNTTAFPLQLLVSVSLEMLLEFPRATSHACRMYNSMKASQQKIAATVP